MPGAGVEFLRFRDLVVTGFGASGGQREGGGKRYSF